MFFYKSVIFFEHTFVTAVMAAASGNCNTKTSAFSSYVLCVSVFNTAQVHYNHKPNAGKYYMQKAWERLQKTLARRKASRVRERGLGEKAGLTDAIIQQRVSGGGLTDAIIQQRVSGGGLTDAIIQQRVSANVEAGLNFAAVQVALDADAGQGRRLTVGELAALMQSVRCAVLARAREQGFVCNQFQSIRDIAHDEKR